ncbi:MAG: A/G-specific adenine glycosylase [Fimbriimonadaceae bacterium]|nr:A/G-specific adenine glycosylase [Fimbriimonadaceae bacterium]
MACCKTSTSVNDLQRRLLDWYDGAKRDLPWRVSRDPYPVLVSELMLQQTTVAAVGPYFTRWMERFPDVLALARAEEGEVLAKWQGLGYYIRARNLHAAARHVVREGWPTGKDAWRRLPGIGDYTSGALASIVDGQAVPAVDGNVVRVYARLCGDGTTGARLLASARDWAAQAVEPRRPGDWNQALMELGATVCRPRSPLCGRCPLAELCTAFREGTQANLPGKNPRPETVRVPLSWRVTLVGGALAMRQAGKGEWWQGLWLSPYSRDAFDEGLVLGTVRCAVTKHRITAGVRLVRAETLPPGFTKVPLARLEETPRPTPERKAWAIVEPYLFPNRSSGPITSESSE